MPKLETIPNMDYQSETQLEKVKSKSERFCLLDHVRCP